MKQEVAETIALSILSWLVGNEDLLPVFLGSSGADAAQIRSGARDPEFLGAVLDFVLMDDAWIEAACDAMKLGYDQPMLARAALPGGERINWT